MLLPEPKPLPALKPALLAGRLLLAARFVFMVTEPRLLLLANSRLMLLHANGRLLLLLLNSLPLLLLANSLPLLLANRWLLLPNLIIIDDWNGRQLQQTESVWP